MVVDDISSINKYLKENIETELVCFLNKYDKRYFGDKHLKSFPEERKQIKPDKFNDNAFKVFYPFCPRDNFESSDGFELSYLDQTEGKFLSIGNFSIELGVKHNQKSFQIISYSYKYWYPDNSYILFGQEQLEKRNFNIRIDWDERHKDEGLEFHSSFLHTVPRIVSTQQDVKCFLDYLDKSVLRYSLRVSSGLDDHIGLINR